MIRQIIFLALIAGPAFEAVAQCNGPATWVYASSVALRTFTAP